MNGNFTDEARSIFVTGLKNAHAMENQALSIMQPQLQRIKNYPAVAQRLQEHIQETEGQKKRLEALLDELAESPSSLKETALSAIGGMASMGHAMAGDEIVKNSLANFAFENYEIAAYKSLMALATAGGMDDTRQVLAQNLAEEEAMAGWLQANIEPITLQFAGLREAGETAKR